ncbi:MAG TPA: hypothetical protein VGH92_10600 [Gaiellaceae bacterium]
MATTASRRFNWSSNKRTLVLGLAAASAVAAAVIVSLPHHQSRKRTAVSQYITSVDGIEQQMAYSLGRASSAYRAFASSKAPGPGTAKKLAQAERTLGLLAGRISALAAPPQARRLRSLVLRVVREEESATHEIHELVVFQPPFNTALKKLHVASQTMSKRLAAVHAPVPHAIRGTKKQIAQAKAAFAAKANAAAAAQADAVMAYDAAAVGVERSLRELRAPPVLAPAYAAQVAALTATVKAGSRLAAELRNPARTKVAELSRAFALATRRSQTLAAQRAEVAAVKAYDRRVRKIQASAAAVRDEITRLQQQLP